MPAGVRPFGMKIDRCERIRWLSTSSVGSPSLSSRYARTAIIFPCLVLHEWRRMQDPPRS
jgi:hypothetical protein